MCYSWFYHTLVYHVFMAFPVHIGKLLAPPLFRINFDAPENPLKSQAYWYTQVTILQAECTQIFLHYDPHTSVNVPKIKYSKFSSSRKE